MLQDQIKKANEEDVSTHIEIAKSYEKMVHILVLPAIRFAFGNNVDIGEVVYYNSALTSTNSNTVCNYLNNKWCI